jgi:PAS domain S-box-containing protein
MSDYEQERLAALRSYRVLDTPRQESFDRVVHLAAALFDVPMAAISLIDADRQWFKAEIGVNASQTPRELAFCNHTIAQQDGLLVVEDATKDVRFQQNPVVTGSPHIRFYAGSALTTPDGHNLGALCVIDTKPLHPTKTMLAQLEILAKLAVGELELMRANAINAEKEQLLDLAEHMSGVGHWRYDLESGRITRSDEVYRIYGVTRETHNLELDDAISFYHPDDRQGIRDSLAHSIATGEGYAAERRVIGKDGVTRNVMTKAVCERNAAGKVVAMFGVFQDITAHRQALEAANAAAAVKAEFLANMSHELRTPLTSIIGFSELLRARPNLDEAALGYVDRVLNGSHALLATVNDVLDFSKLESGQVEIKPRPVPSRQLFSNVIDLLSSQADAKGITLQLDISPAVPGAVLIDPDRMRQILLNLVGNAVKFTAKGGVTVRVDYDAAQMLRFSVADTGPGIAPEQTSRLFQRFSQVDGSLSRSNGGTGLGLAICKGLVEAMGGQIGVTSVVGQGSDFHAWIPCRRAESQQDTNAAKSAQVSLAAYRILVVDDNMSNRALVAASLQTTAVALTMACDGAEAVEKSAQAPFDLILLDLHMPVMDGFAALDVIRDTPGPNRTVPIMAFTADGDPHYAQQLLEMGFDGCITKPILPSELIRKITHILVGEESQLPDMPLNRMAHHA